MKTILTTISILFILSSFATVIQPKGKHHPTKPKKTVNLDVCKECQGNEFIFDGSGVSFMRVFNYKGHLMELNTMLPKSQIIYTFEKAGSYTIEINYANGDVMKKEVVVFE
ncbi:MAG: hypothetical protein ABJG68_16265 [Crocinitomicaceae bacterium]